MKIFSLTCESLFPHHPRIIKFKRSPQPELIHCLYVYLLCLMTFYILILYPAYRHLIDVTSLRRKQRRNLILGGMFSSLEA